MIKDWSSQRKRLKAKYTSAAVYQRILLSIFKYGILIGLTFVIIFPFISNLCSVFMSKSDLYDTMVRFIPKQPTLDNLKYMIERSHYWKLLLNTVELCLLCAVIQTFVCSLVGYGLAAFRFRGRGLVFGGVLLTMLIPTSTIIAALFHQFRNFDLFGLIKLITGSPIRMLDSIWPVVILSLSCLAVKNGLYIFVFRQYYKGVPEELAEAAIVDGAGTFRVYFNIMWPMSANISLTVFLLSFAWQWTDQTYSTLFFQNEFLVMSNMTSFTSNMVLDGIVSGTVLDSAMKNTALFLVIIPLVLFFFVAQRFLVQGVERSGLVG